MAAIGINPENFSDYTTVPWTRDLIKCARLWGSIAHWYDGTMDSAPNPFPVGKDFAGGWDFKGAYPVGTCLISFIGQGTLQVFSGMTNLKLTKTGNVTTGTVQLSNNQEAAWFTMTGTSSSNPISNFQIMAPGFQLGDTELFHPNFLTSLCNSNGTPYPCLRLMGAGCMNGMNGVLNPLTTWASRVTPDQQQTNQLKGISHEWMIRLANELGCDVWICVPILATTDYVQGLAKLCETLNPGLNLYIELSNELWNGQYPQNAYINKTAQVLNLLKGGTGNPFSNLCAYIGELSYQLAQTWNSAGGRTARIVLPGQFGAYYSYIYACQYLEATYGKGAVAKNFYALSGAPYVQNNNVNGEDTTVDLVFADMVGFLKNNILPWIADTAAVAKQYGVGMVGYESGQSLFPSGSANYADYAAMTAAQSDPRMITQIYAPLYAAWFAAGGLLVNHLAHIDTWSKEQGFWGSKQTYTDTTTNQKYNWLISQIPTTGPVNPPPPPPTVYGTLAINMTVPEGSYSYAGMTLTLTTALAAGSYKLLAGTAGNTLEFDRAVPVGAFTYTELTEKATLTVLVPIVPGTYELVPV